MTLCELRRNVDIRFLGLYHSLYPRDYGITPENGGSDEKDSSPV